MVDADRPHGSFRRRLRRVALAAAGGAVLLAGATLWLLRDPGPRFAERRSELVAVEEGPAERSGDLISQPVRLTASSGLNVDVLVRTPVEGTGGALVSASAEGPGRRPLFFILGGYRTGEQAAMLVEETRGAVVAAMRYPYDGPLDVAGLAVVRYLPEIRGALLDTPPAVQLALDYLLGRPEVDPARVELMGVSLGAFLAAVPAALDERVGRLWLIHGAAHPYRVLEHGLARYVPYALPRALVAALANLVLAGPLLAPEEWVPRVAPRPVVIINAEEDRRLPRQAVEALYASARHPKEQVWLSGEHVQPNRPEVIERMMDVVLTRAAEEPLVRGPADGDVPGSGR